MEEDAKIAAQKSGRLSFYVVNAIADGCTFNQTSGRFFVYQNQFSLPATQIEEEHTDKHKQQVDGFAPQILFMEHHCTEKK